MLNKPMSLDINPAETKRLQEIQDLLQLHPAQRLEALTRILRKPSACAKALSSGR